MENFIVSARKYRPATFDMVVGQDSITNTLKSAIKNRHLAQAYLFCGPRGVGKTTCARIFAKTINCSNLGENGEACDKCESCLSFNSLRSFSIHELDAASNNKVDDIRLLTDQVRIPPQIGRYSIYIIDEVHMLSSSAFNAFLKTLEEPPSHAIFILATTEKHKIIPTILSRCQIFDFSRIRVEAIVSRLAFVAKNEAVTADEEALHVIAQKADGALRDALSIFDQIVSFSGRNISYKDVIDNLNVLDYEYYFRTVDEAIAGNVSKALLIFNEVLDKGFDGHNFIAGLNSHLRDLLVCKDEVTLKLLEATPSVRQRYAKQAASCPAEFLYNALEAGTNCDISYKNSKNQRLHVELALIRICRLIPDKDQAEKKKPDHVKVSEPAAEIPVPSKSEIIREKTEPGVEKISRGEATLQTARNEKELNRELRSFSIKDIISDEQKPYPVKDADKAVSAEKDVSLQSLEQLTPEAFRKAWTDFAGEVKSDGPRVISMFKSINPEIHPDRSITIHLNNAAQRDLFVQNYKQKLMNWLESRFNMSGIPVEAIVDQSEADGIIYSDEQKYNYLISKYPAVKDARKAFNLDFE